LGRCVTRLLTAGGESVRVLDVARPGESDMVGGVVYVVADARYFDAVYDSMKDVETVVNLASLTNAVESVERPREYLENNLKIHINILESARRRDVDLVVLASSAAVYGAQDPPHREDLPARPLNPYGISKQCCELLSKAYYQNYGVGAVVLRYFNILGEGGRNVLREFVERTAAGQAPIVKGVSRGGRFIPASRDFVYVGDAAEATVSSLRLKKRYEVINIASGKPTSVEALARTVAEEIGKKIEPERRDLLPHEPLISYADITRARERLGWTPKTSLREIVKRYWAWFHEINRKNRG